MSAIPSPLPAQRHSVVEGALAIFAGTLFVSLAMVLFAQVGLLTGGTAGLARLFAIERLHPTYAAVLGGLLLGAGCLFLA